MVDVCPSPRNPLPGNIRCISIRFMRTTLDIDDDVLQVAKERARREHKTAGHVVSELLRQALTAPFAGGHNAEPTPLYGFQPFAATGRLVTNEQINELRGDDAY